MFSLPYRQNEQNCSAMFWRGVQALLCSKSVSLSVASRNCSKGKGVSRLRSSCSVIRAQQGIKWPASLHLVTGFLFWPQVFFFLFYFVFPHASFCLQLFISGTKAKCLAVSQIKGLLLPPRKRWNNKYGRRWNQSYLLLAPDSHICATPLSVSHTAAAEAGAASAQCLPACITWQFPRKQLTGTQTASQMMDRTGRIRRDRERWGCRSGHHWTWGRGADAVSCISSVCVFVCWVSAVVC